MPQKPQSRRMIIIYNLLFVALGAALVIFLLNAPPESTAKLPYDESHARFYDMGKKEAEKFCQECHYPEGIDPLPADHPPKYRCLFCHKKKPLEERE